MCVEWVKGSSCPADSYQNPRESSPIGFTCPFKFDAGPHNAALLMDSQVHLQILKVTFPYPHPWGHIIHFM